MMRESESEGSVVCEGFYFLYRMNIKTPPLIILLKPSKVRMIMMDEASKRMMNEWMLFLPQGGVRRRPKKVPLSFSALARGALQAPGCAEDRHSPPAGPPEGRRRQWCARRNDDERTWVKQRDTKGSWIVDRGCGSKIQNALFCLDSNFSQG